MLSPHKLSVVDRVRHQPDALCLFALGLLSLATRFALFGYPSVAVFDEVHFNYFVGFYSSGYYFYDIHPPLGKLLLALAGMPAGEFTPDLIARVIGSPFKSEHFLWMRALPSLLGSCVPLFIFAIARELNLSRSAAFCAGALIALDNALILQSRLILLDGILLFFGFASLLVFLIARRRRSLSLYLCSALLAGCSLSVKWLGVSFLGLIGLVMIADWVTAIRKSGWDFEPFKTGCLFLATALSVYVLAFAIHFQLVPKAYPQGDQYMSPNFQSTLEHSRYQRANRYLVYFKCPPEYEPDLEYGMLDGEINRVDELACQIQFRPVSKPGFWRKFAELNRVMYSTNQALKATHNDASPWYGWPLMNRPIHYWSDDGQRIFMLGNPGVWLLSTLGVALFIAVLFVPKSGRESASYWILLAGYWANLLPFIFVDRIMFLYHYFTSLCFAVLILAWLIDRTSHASRISWLIVPAAAFGFVLVSPLTYGVTGLAFDGREVLRWFNDIHVALGLSTPIEL